MPATRTTLRRSLAAAAALPLLAVALTACGYGSEAKDNDKVAPAAKGEKIGGLDEVKIGYFANVTHATALVGLQEGLIQKELGGTEIKPQVFNAGPSEIEALNAGAIDIGWIGPSPRSTASRSRTARTCASSPVRPPAVSRWSSTPRRSSPWTTSRASASPPRSSATPRTWRCSTTCRRRA